MNDISVPRRGRPRKSLFAPKPQAEEAETTVAAVAEETVARPTRLSPKAESPRDRAARRAAEIRGHNGGALEDGTDQFYIDPASVPDGWCYEWKVRSVLGAEDPAREVDLRRRGWEPVEASRHPEMMPRGSTAADITRKGMVLMERPLELTQEARNNELNAAREQVNIRAGQVDPKGRGGLIDRSDANTSMKIKKSYSPMVIPD